ALRGACHDAHLLAARFHVAVQRRVWADIGEIDGPRKDRLDCARAGVVDEPFDLQIGYPRFEPAFAPARQTMRDEALDMGDVREMADTEHGRLGGEGCKAERKKERG